MFLRTSLTPGAADIVGRFGSTGDVRITGDWDGDGLDTLGVVRGKTRFLKDDLTSGGAADRTASFGVATDIAVTGDWDGDGTDTPGVARNTPTGIVWYLRNANSTGPVDAALVFGP